MLYATYSIEYPSRPWGLRNWCVVAGSDLDELHRAAESFGASRRFFVNQDGIPRYYLPHPAPWVLREAGFDIYMCGHMIGIIEEFHAPTSVYETLYDYPNRFPTWNYVCELLPKGAWFPLPIQAIVDYTPIDDDLFAELRNMRSTLELKAPPESWIRRQW